MFPIKRIYIDSCLTSTDSASESDFKIDLPTTLLVPEDNGFFIDDVCVPHTCYPVEADVNDDFFRLTTSAPYVLLRSPVVTVL